MPSYAILGATGSTGSEMVRLLSSRPDTEVRCLVRNRAKLESQQPSTLPPNIVVREGSVNSVDNLLELVKGTQAILIALGPAGNMPGCTIVEDCIKPLVTALRTLRDEPDAENGSKLPFVILLSSASLTNDFRQAPLLARKMAHAAFGHIYNDVWIGEQLLRAESSWLSSTFVKPGGLLHGPAMGHEVTLDGARASAWLRWADVAAAMVELADEQPAGWEGKDVRVVTKVAPPMDWEMLTPLTSMVKGLLNYFFPWSYRWIH